MDQLSNIQSFQPSLHALEAMPSSPPAQAGPLDFKNVFQTTLDEVNALDTQGKTMVEALATGQTNDISGVMLAVKKANLAFMSLLQIRNQMMEAYQEIMRMRV